jgi:hypothetical protein
MRCLEFGYEENGKDFSSKSDVIKHYCDELEKSGFSIAPANDFVVLSGDTLELNPTLGTGV